MTISVETLAKILIVAGFVQRYGTLKVGLVLLGVSFVMAVIASLLEAYKIAKLKQGLMQVRGY